MNKIKDYKIVQIITEYYGGLKNSKVVGAHASNNMKEAYYYAAEEESRP